MPKLKYEHAYLNSFSKMCVDLAAQVSKMLTLFNAKTMMAFMVRGVFTPLRFPYAHFPCKRVTGELLFQPFWEAVYRLERMGLKVNPVLSVQYQDV